MLIRKKDHS